MRDWTAQQVAAITGAELLSAPSADEASGPAGAAIDTRALNEDELFVGLAGEREDGGAYAEQALRAGAWGVLATPEHAARALAANLPGAVLAHSDPLAGLQALARAWRRELGRKGARVVAVTGSTGKTSTKDILAAMLSGLLPTAASPANLNTEIGLPLAILAAAGETRALVLEMAMRGPGQIAELTAIAEPDVGVIVNVGPAHLELLGSLEAIAAAKAELIAGLAPEGTVAVVPVDEPLLRGHLREEVRTITFGPGGDVSLTTRATDGWVEIDHDGEKIRLRPSFAQAHNLSNLLAAVAATRALGLTPEGPLEVSFSAMRGQRVELPGEMLLIEDCYNANPMSMRAAIDDLRDSPGARRVAVLGDMLELGPQGPELHRQTGAHAAASGVELLVTVGPLAEGMVGAFAGPSESFPDAATAAERLPALLREGDTVLLKGSRGVGLERVALALKDMKTPGMAGLTGSGRR
jgi:UDP-N-acetylmuramoyl-tripeptide--D-alanyl-D-alanine ligase